MHMREQSRLSRVTKANCSCSLYTKKSHEGTISEIRGVIHRELRSRGNLLSEGPQQACTSINIDIELPRIFFGMLDLGGPVGRALPIDIYPTCTSITSHLQDITRCVPCREQLLHQSLQQSATVLRNSECAKLCKNVARRPHTVPSPKSIGGHADMRTVNKGTPFVTVAAARVADRHASGALDNASGKRLCQDSQSSGVIRATKKMSY